MDVLQFKTLIKIRVLSWLQFYKYYQVGNTSCIILVTDLCLFLYGILIVGRIVMLIFSWPNSTAWIYGWNHPFMDKVSKRLVGFAFKSNPCAAGVHVLYAYCY